VSAIGKLFEPVTYAVGREKIREYAQAVGETNPLHSDLEAARAAGYADVVAPPTFAIVVSLEAAMAVLQDPDVALDYSRVVHGEQRFELHRPVHAGDVVVATSTVAEIRDVGRNEMMRVVSEIRTTDGEHVATATNTMISRGTAAKES
jgi:acyl dehydratase